MPMMLRLLLFLLGKDIIERNYGGAKCPKFNIVAAEELNNLELAQIIADAQGRELNYELVDFTLPVLDMIFAMLLMVIR